MSRKRSSTHIWTSNGTVYFVAVVGSTDTWTARVLVFPLGELPPDPEGETLAFGERLCHSLAEVLFPQLAQQFTWRP